jgi:hypothetical protein
LVGLFGEGDEGAALPKQAERPYLRIAADRVDDEVDRLALELLLERGGAVVDRPVAPQVPEQVKVVGRRRADHTGTFGLGELNGHGPDPAGGGVDQHGLAGCELAGVEQRHPSGQRTHRDGGGLREVQRARLDR